MPRREEIPNLNRLVPADEALELVLENTTSVGSENIALKDAGWRVVSRDLVARRTQPPFPASAMDGYAVTQSDIGALPATLQIVGESAAGHPFPDQLESGQAVRIFTGGVVPDGADTIIIQENTTAEKDTVKILQNSPIGKFIRPAGLDFKHGETLINAGSTLNAAMLSLAASMDYPEVEVFRKPKVALLATGDELVMPGEATGDGQIIASNTFGIAAMVKKLGAETIDLGIAKDTLPALQTKIEEAIEFGADLIITMGGASVGDHDLVKPAFENAGFIFKLAKIAMRPGKPFLFATRELGNKTVRMAGLAGNPVSSLVASHVFVKPLIERLCGTPQTKATPTNAVLAIPLPQNDEREEYMRATSLLNSDGQLVVTPFSRQDSSQLNLLVQANCLMIRPKNAPAAKVGDPCTIIRMD